MLRFKGRRSEAQSVSLCAEFGRKPILKGRPGSEEKAKSFTGKEKFGWEGLDSNQDSQIRRPDPDHPRTPDKPLKR